MNGSVYENATNASYPTAIVTCAFNVPLMLTSIISNSFVLAAIFTNSSLRSPSIILLSCLAVSDVAVGLIAQPLYIARQFSSADFLLSLSEAVGTALCGISLSTMAVISVDRYLALQYHMTYNNVVTTSRVVFTIIIIWLFNVPFSTLKLLNISSNFYGAYVLIILYTITASISYTGIYRIVRRHQLHIRVQQQALQIDTEHHLRVVSLKRTAVNTFIFFICSLLCYFPWLICRFYYSEIVVAKTKLVPVALSSTATLLFANSSINPFLYCWRLRELRVAVIKKVRKITCKRTIIEGNS